MKLATYKDGSRDGQLVVVSRDLGLAHFATGIASRLQQVLDDWNFLSPQLQDLTVTLNQGRARHAFTFEPRQCMAPLPRAYQWAEGSAYPSHLARLRLAQGAAGSAGGATDAASNPEAAPTTAPTASLAAANALRMIRGGSDHFLGPCDDAWFGSGLWDIDFGAGLAVITGDVPMGAGADQALDGVRLLMLANAWRLRNRLPADGATGLDGLQRHAATAFSPVAVTPDELGEAWQGGRVHLSLQSAINGQPVDCCDAGPAMRFHFGQLIAHLARTRRLGAGSVVGSGPVSNPEDDQDWHGIAEQRAVEPIASGAPRTPCLVDGDTVRIEVQGRDGLSVFGRIEQRVGRPPDASAPPADPDAG